eukprot:TRINITY_DN15294_c0_g1_i4.p1 TRINITY_DN15294_c0_g1~~TRINITY_DN15294_c0_g1_i4.p1  ORF type:complete len:102 (+),score=28.98 TRINITY_DN15294_c0_g1_i4:167-472(+)
MCIRDRYMGTVQEDDETMKMAFSAMESTEGEGGIISAEKLTEVIKNEFEMTIDIEGLIKEIDQDGNGTIDFDEFKSLLTSCLLYTSPSPRDLSTSRMPSSA